MENSRFKFRVWDKILKEYNEYHDYILFEDGTLGEYDSCSPVQEWYEIEQCTGLKDKNGNLIYEGDIIKDEFCRRFTIVWSEEDCMFEGRVIYRDPEYSDRFDLYKGATDDCEIIGNIHEQAEQKRTK